MFPKNVQFLNKMFSKLKIVLVTQKSTKLSKFRKFTRFQFCVHILKKLCFQICSRFFKIVLRFKICSQNSTNVRTLKNCSRLQVCSGFFKIVLCFKICSQDSKNVRALKKCSCFQICSQASKIIRALKNCSQIPNMFRFSKNVREISKMFVFLNILTFVKTRT